MLLDLAKAFSFFGCILVLYQAAIHAFFVPGTHWQERMAFALVRLAFAACVCYSTGLLFTLPLRSNPDRHQSLAKTLPVRLYHWSLAAIILLFAAGWYLTDLAVQAGSFVSNHTLQRY